MLRNGLGFIFGAGVFLGILSLLPAAPNDKTETLLAVQRALAEGRDYLKAGHPKAAVETLERELGGDYSPLDNREFRRALSDAYLGYITELQHANRTDEAAVYLRRLKRLDPGATLEVQGVLPVLPAAPATPVPTTVAIAVPKTLLPPLPHKGAVTPPTAPAVSLITLAPGSAGPTVTARGQVKEEPKDDPFDDANSRTGPAVRELLERAEREFDAAGKEKTEAARAARYTAAGRLYEQAEHTLKGSTTAARECWAYCKLHGVVEALNRQGGTVAPQELEKEVRLALSMAPKLDGIGRDLLRRIQERQGTTLGSGASTHTALERTEDAAIAVKHTPRQGNSWAVAETAHFRIFHVQSTEVAEKLARIAETARLMAARKWFGEPLPAWPTRCDVYVYNTADEYAQATQQSPRCPGHSTMPMEGDRVLSRRIDVHCDDPNVSIGVLPHEVTHVVLAGHFPAAVPRWADEGMAVLSEPQDRIERHLHNLPTHAQQRQLFNVAQLMSYDKKYPEPQMIGPFYAQSVSVVDYLSRLRGPQVFAQFLAEGMRGNYETALLKYYKIHSFQDLDVAWQRHALGDGQSARASTQP